MHTFAITPAESIGPIRLGMTRIDSQNELQRYSGALDAHSSTNECDYYFSNAFQVYFTPSDLVDWIQVCPQPSFRAMLFDDDVADTPARVLATHVCDAVGATVEFDPEENYSFPSLQLFLWEADDQYDIHQHTRRIYGAVGIDSRPYDSTQPLVTTY